LRPRHFKPLLAAYEYFTLQIFQFNQALAPRTYANFQMPPNTSYQVFLLQPGTDFTLRTQNFITLQPTITISSDSLVALRMTKTKTSGRNCSPDAIAAHETECIVSHVEEQIKAANWNCTPFIFYDAFPSLKKPVCTGEDDAHNKTIKVCKSLKDITDIE
jgi:hypothetical protein